MMYDMHFVYSKAVYSALEDLEAERLQVETPRSFCSKDNIITRADICRLPKIYEELPESVRTRIQNSVLQLDDPDDTMEEDTQKSGSKKGFRLDHKLPKLKLGEKGGLTDRSSNTRGSKRPALLTQTRFPTGRRK